MQNICSKLLIISYKKGVIDMKKTYYFIDKNGQRLTKKEKTICNMRQCRMLKEMVAMPTLKYQATCRKADTQKL